MKITEVITTPVSIPFYEPAVWSNGTRHSAPSLVVQIQTDEGLVGLGECVGPTIPVMRAVVEKEFKPFLTGQDPQQTEYLLHQMEEYCNNWTQIGYYGLAGIEIALLDLKAKILNTPLYNLLGGLYRKEVRFAGYIFINQPEVNAREAVALVQQGYGELKMKVGRDVDLDVARVAAVRSAVGPKIPIRVDPNQNWSVATAIRAIRRMEKYGIQLVEQPVPTRDIAGLVQVKQAIETPITADEACATFEDALRLIEARAVDAFTIDPSEAGGLLRARQIVNLADSASIHCIIGSWAETGVGTMANVHLAASSRNFPFANDTHYHLMDGDILTAPVDFTGGAVQVPQSPGLGIELDPVRMARYAQDEVREMVFFDGHDSGYIPRVGRILP